MTEYSTRLRVGLGLKTRSTDNISQQRWLYSLKRNWVLYCHNCCQTERERGREREMALLFALQTIIVTTRRTQWQIHPRDGCVWGQPLFLSTTATTTIASFIHPFIRSNCVLTRWIHMHTGQEDGKPFSSCSQYDITNEFSRFPLIFRQLPNRDNHHKDIHCKWT